MRFSLLPVLLFLSVGLSAQAPFPLQQYGNGGCDTGVYVPTFHTGGVFPILGNSNFHVISRNLIGQAPGVVWVSMKSAHLTFPGLTLLVDPTNPLGVLGHAEGTAGVAGVGTATIPLPIPNDFNLIGASLFLQGFFVSVLSPLSWVYTQGLKLTIVPSVSPLVSALYDRVAYQKYVTNSSQGLAVWKANAVKGFTYVKTQQFTCGGQSHWMVIVKDNKYGIEFVLIPGGSFRMGGLNKLGHPYEYPPHWVHLEPFLLARTEVTQGQWRAVMGTTPWKGWSNVWTGANASAYAANWLTWNVTMTFCAKTGWRLPSESEWEYACRAGTTTSYFYGSNSSRNLGQYAWYDQNTLYINQKYPHQAGVKLPNAFGLHDMHGNVMEWCQDRWHSNYKCAPANGLPWNTGSSRGRVDRGGGWSCGPKLCRSASRDGGAPTIPYSRIGLRPARSLR